MSKNRKKSKIEDNKHIQSLLDLYINQKDSSESINVENLLVQTHILWSLKRLSSKKDVEFSKILSRLNVLKEKFINLLKSGKQIKIKEDFVIIMRDSQGVKYLGTTSLKEENNYIIPSALIGIYDILDNNEQIKDFIEIFLEILQQAIFNDLFVYTDSFAFVKNISGDTLIPISRDFLDHINTKSRKKW